MTNFQRETMLKILRKTHKEIFFFHEIHILEKLARYFPSQSENLCRCLFEEEATLVYFSDDDIWSLATKGSLFDIPRMVPKVNWILEKLEALSTQGSMPLQQYTL
jgi:hypothetical protein